MRKEEYYRCETCGQLYNNEMVRRAKRRRATR